MTTYPKLLNAWLVQGWKVQSTVTSTPFGYAGPYRCDILRKTGCPDLVVASRGEQLGGVWPKGSTIL